jgi:hypothetical protein
LSARVKCNFWTVIFNSFRKGKLGKPFLIVEFTCNYFQFYFFPRRCLPELWVAL